MKPTPQQIAAIAEKVLRDTAAESRFVSGYAKEEWIKSALPNLIIQLTKHLAEGDASSSPLSLKTANRIGFCSGVQCAIGKLESMLTIFNGYPQNKLTALDIKEFVDNELDMLRGTLKANKILADEEKPSVTFMLSPKANPKCQRIGGCLHALGFSECCCDDNSCDGQEQPTDEEKTGVSLIAKERARQISAEGWTPEHDDEHTSGELAGVAAMYIIESDIIPPRCPVGWPWERSWWKPSQDPIKNLVKAGALIAAEIDRLNRKAKTMSESKDFGSDAAHDKPCPQQPTDKSLDGVVEACVVALLDATGDLQHKKISANEFLATRREAIKQAILTYTASLQQQNEQLRKELEDVKENAVMRLAAISTASISNTEETWKDCHNCHKDYQSTAFFDVLCAIRREMDKRKERDTLKQQVKELTEMLAVQQK